MANEFRPLILKAGGNQIGEDQRVRVQGSKNMTLLSDFFLFEVYNLTDEDLSYITGNKMLYAYAEGGGLLCCGEIDGMYTRVDNTNVIYTISVVDGQSFWDKKITKSFGGGTTVSSTFRGIVEGASVGAFNADDLRIIRGQTYTGRLAECISDLAKTVHARAFITNNSVYVTAKGRATETISLTDEEIIDDRNNSDGLRIIKTIVKGYPIGAFIQISGSIYRLVSQKITADNLKGNWESILVLVNENVLPINGMEGG